MAIEGKFWLLWEEEPLDAERGRVVELRDGAILDGRTGEVRGTYADSPDGIDMLFIEDHGEREVIKMRAVPRTMTAEPVFTPDADCYLLEYSTARYEAYQAARPLNEHETDEERWARRDAEAEVFGLVGAHGVALRDGPYIREVQEANKRAAGMVPV